MFSIASLLLAAAVSAVPIALNETPMTLRVDCAEPRALELALARAAKLDDVDIYIDGVCHGHYRIESDGVTLRSGSTNAELRSPSDDPTGVPVLLIDNVTASVRDLIIRGPFGVRAEGDDADALIYGCNILGSGQGGGVIAERGSTIRVRESSVRDHAVAMVATDYSQLFVIDSEVIGNDTAISNRESKLNMFGSTVAENSSVGVGMRQRSYAIIGDTVFANNGDVHIGAVDRSDVTLLGGVALGSSSDSTRFALTSTRGSRVSASLAPDVYGDVSALDDGALNLRGGTLHGDLLIQIFSRAYVTSAVIDGFVVCGGKSEALCGQVSSSGSFECGTTECGAPIALDALGELSEAVDFGAVPQDPIAPKGFEERESGGASSGAVELRRR